MEPKEFDNIINEALMDETRLIIKEQLKMNDNLINSVKSFQSLSGMIDKIVGIETMGSGVQISIKGVTPEELVDCCGGDSLGKTQTNLMQSLHHDLEESGIDGTFDININTDGDENSLNLTINIDSNDDELSKENNTDMKEQEPKDTNPTSDKKKNMILGGTELSEHHKHDKKSQIDFICKNDKTCKREDLLKLSDKEVKAKYLALEKKMGITESKKKTLTLTESEMAGLIEKIILEAGENPHLATPVRGVPGVDVTKKNRDDSGKENDDALKAIEDKIKKYLSFEGNTDPEFPEQVGKGKQNVATKNTKSEDEVVDLNRGRHSADLVYDQEPSEQFKERAKLSLVGASKMGNSSEYANAIPSKVGENMLKTADKRKEARSTEPLYNKESVPVKETPSKKERYAPDASNEGDAVASDILRMKQMSNYKEKTQ